MKITVTTSDGAVHRVQLPYLDVGYVNTGIRCPACGAEQISVSGTGKWIESPDTYAATAVHDDPACRAVVGVIRARVSTLFGLEEDERVFSRGIRVY